MEAALVLPVLLVVALAIFEVVGAVVVQVELVAAAREGVRVAATVPDPEAAVIVVRDVLGPSLGGSVRVDVIRPGEVGRPARVTVRIDKHLTTPLLDGITIPLGASAAMRVEP